LPIELKIKNLDGTVGTIRVEQLLAVDGAPYKASPDDLREALIHLEGRLTAVEHVLQHSLTPRPSDSRTP